VTFRITRITVCAGGLATLVLAGSPTIAQAVTTSSPISTIAGTAVAGFSGDGGAATNAQVNQPRDADVGPDGAIYLADTYNNRIRKIEANGSISTIVGTGIAGSTGDGKQARKARIALPHDVAIDDNTGLLYIADSNSHRIRQVDKRGIINTVAGTGQPGFSGDGQVATLATLRYPKSVAVFGGALYLADSMNHRIRKIDSTTRIITTAAGTGVASYTGDGGPGAAATFNTPQRIALDPSGNLYVADTLNHAIRRIDPAQRVTTVLGTGTPGSSGDGGNGVLGTINTPRGVSVDGSDTLYVSDTGSNRVRSLNLRTGIISPVAGSGSTGYSGDGGPAGSARLKNPRGLAVDNQGGLIIADTFNSAFRRVAP